MPNLFSKNYNKRTRFTRMCIGEAVFALMDKKAYSAIKISDIVKKAGVSRMTFYHYYESKEDALADFFHEIVAGYVRECISGKGKYGKFHDVLEAVSGQEELESHRQIIQAIRKRDKEAASKLMYEHLQDSIDCLKQ